VAERDASKTALGVAALRAVHQLFDAEPKILEDPIAAQLLDADFLTQVRENRERANDPVMRALRGHVVLRSRYSEDRLAAAVKRGIRQCVILGAGFDTFAYRPPEWAKPLRIFEVDHPGTQREKRERLQVAGIAIPDNLEFVSIDFERVSLHDGLRASTLDFSQPTFFSCLGVLVYLSEEAIRAVFQLVASFPASSEIVFTFSMADSALSEKEVERKQKMAARVDSLGEPWQTHFDPEQLARELGEYGFSEFTILDTEQERQYFADRHDQLRPGRRSPIAAAIVGSR
jgi:methyltransferase (TIGR00027 family)